MSVREKLPNRRYGESLNFQCGNVAYVAGLGFYAELGGAG